MLRRGYGFAADRLVRALRDFAGLPGVTLEDPRLAATALDWAEQGLDFADALHLAAARACTAFMTFDRRLAKVAAGVVEIRWRRLRPFAAPELGGDSSVLWSFG